MRALPHLARSATVAAPAESPGIRSVDKDVGGGRLNVVDTGLRNGIRIWTAMEDTLAEMIAKRRLVQVLRDWCPSFPGCFLYYPSRRNQPAPLAALIAALHFSE